jgi:hypothetical protein
MMLVLLRRLAVRLREEDGAIAMLTLAFMLFLGLVMVAYLWAIGYAAGAYNTMATASQAAAYAAVSTGSYDSPTGQLTFACPDPANPPTNGQCTSGKTAAAGLRALSYAITNTRAHFNLSYDSTDQNNGTLKTLDANGNQFGGAGGIMAYSIAAPPEAAREAAGSSNCRVEGAGIDNGIGAYPPNSDTPARLCWTGPATALATPQYESGVVVRVTTDVKLPICGQICPQFPITAAAAAKQSQNGSIGF